MASSFQSLARLGPGPNYNGTREEFWLIWNVICTELLSEKGVLEDDANLILELLQMGF